MDTKNTDVLHYEMQNGLVPQLLTETKDVVNGIIAAIQASLIHLEGFSLYHTMTTIWYEVYLPTFFHTQLPLHIPTQTIV